MKRWLDLVKENSEPLILLIVIVGVVYFISRIYHYVQ